MELPAQSSLLLLLLSTASVSDQLCATHRRHSGSSVHGFARKSTEIEIVPS